MTAMQQYEFIRWVDARDREARDCTDYFVSGEETASSPFVLDRLITQRVLDDSASIDDWRWLQMVAVHK